MPEFNYEFHYAQWHVDSAEHHEQMVKSAGKDLTALRLPKADRGRALDVGSGRGFLIEALSKRGYEAEGIESSPQQIAFSRERGHLVHESANLADLAGSHAGAFSLVTMFDLLEHIPVNEQLEFLDAAYRLLKPGGTLIVRTPNAASPAASYMRFADWTHTSSFTTHSITPLLQSVGFENIWFKPDLTIFGKARIIRFPMYFLTRFWWRRVLKAFVGTSFRRMPLDANLVLTCTRPQAPAV